MRINKTEDKHAFRIAEPVHSLKVSRVARGTVTVLEALVLLLLLGLQRVLLLTKKSLDFLAVHPTVTVPESLARTVEGKNLSIGRMRKTWKIWACL